MTARPALVVAVALLLAACGGGSDEADITIPEITLIPTTTEAPLFEAGDSETGDADDAPVDTEVTDSVAATDESTTSEPAETESSVDSTVEAPTATDGDSTATTVVGGGETTTDTPTDTTIVTTTTTTTTVAAAPETTQPPVSGGGNFVLGADGLGAVQFGADAEGTITFVTSLLGAPTLDTGWVPPFDIGPCGGTQVRQVSWNDLLLEFGDVSDITQGIDHLYAYYYGRVGSTSPTPAGFLTANDVGVGSTVADLIAAHPGVEFRQGDDFIEPNFSISDSLSGLLSGLADDDVIEVLIGGLPCNG